jgi:uncharacterized membrane protein
MPHDAAPRDGLLGLTYRQLVALIALVNAFVAIYLHLWKIGKAGTLACGGSGGCTLVQFSQWSWVRLPWLGPASLGVDVALIGAIGYTLVLLVALWGTRESLADAGGPGVALAGLIGPAILFTIRLKYAEWVILKTFCPWCFISTVSITLLGVIVALDLRRVRRLARARAEAG